MKADNEQTQRLLMEKSQNDDKYISVLKKEVAKLRKDNEKLRLHEMQSHNLKENKDRINLMMQIKELKRENNTYKKELNMKESHLNELDRTSEAFMKQSLSKPLKKDYVTKITELEREVQTWRDKYNEAEQLFSNNKNENVVDLSKENFRLRLKVNELESKLYGR